MLQKSGDSWLKWELERPLRPGIIRTSFSRLPQGKVGRFFGESTDNAKGSMCEEYEFILRTNMGQPVTGKSGDRDEQGHAHFGPNDN